MPVKRFVLDENDRVIVPDRRFQQRTRVRRGRGNGHEQAGDLEEHRLHRVRVRGAELVAPALRETHHDRDLHLSAEHVVDVRCRVDDLVHREQGEVDGHDLDDRPKPRHRCSDPHADDRVLGDGRVADTLLAELLEQPLSHLEGALEDADVLAHEKDRLVALHLLPQREVEGLPVAHHCHQVCSSSSSCASSAGPFVEASRRRRRWTSPAAA